MGFSVRHLMSKVTGTFAEFSGDITTTGEPRRSERRGLHRVLLDQHENDQRDGHLRSADFFDPTNGGTLTFVSTGIREAYDGYVISGDLTINGITKTVDLAAEFFGVAVDAYGRTGLGAEAHTTIDRKDFKVDWNMPLDGGRLLVGAKIDINLRDRGRQGLTLARAAACSGRSGTGDASRGRSRFRG